MGKYRSSATKREVEKVKAPHFVWRGIGCLMMIIVPAMSIAAGVETVQYGIDQKWPIPYQLLGTPKYPDFFYKSSGLMLILSPITGVKHFYAYVVAALIFMIILGGIVSVGYAFVYQMMAPSRYGPMDAPPPKVKVKRYKR